MIFGLTPASWAVGFSLVGIVFIGLVVLFTLEQSDLPFLPDNVFLKHILFLCISIISAIVLRSLNYLHIGRYAYLLFAITLAMLGAVLVFGWIGRFVPIVGNIFPNINKSRRTIIFDSVYFCKWIFWHFILSPKILFYIYIYLSQLKIVLVVLHN